MKPFMNNFDITEIDNFIIKILIVLLSFFIIFFIFLIILKIAIERKIIYKLKQYF